MPKLTLLTGLLCAGLLSSSLALAEVISQEVDYQDDGETLRGVLYWDDRISGKRPGVLVYPEWWGLNAYAKQRARMLAEQGYLVFAADMYGPDKVTRDASQAKEWMSEVVADPELWRQRAQAALKQLQRSDKVLPERIAAVGYCFGGGTVLQMAYGGGAGLLGVVSFHGSLPAAPAQSKGKIQPQILAYHGQADSFVKPDVVSNFQARLEEAQAQWQMVTFGGVRHSFTNPKVGEYGIPNLKYDELADRRSWAGALAFLKELFAR
ncbi:MAG: dienelactone hydrolase family protein [Gammaproteobacteria bacterium SHHR-1]|uniref:dienelactone hydrolase family protein n=1 Tax=Magnetovirga frankeli TaxID=947516 RepID=UPI001292D067|nr:dienelactone hydrolase family protein [gamma proteobacterium SS-5]